MAFNAEQLNIVVAARTQDLRRELDNAEKRIKRFEGQTKKDLSSTAKSFDMLNGAVGRLGLTLSAGALATGMARSIQNAVNVASEIDNLSRIAGLGTTEFQKFAIAAQTVGIEQDKLADILKDVNDKFGDYMATGAGPLADFFDNIAPKVGIAKEAFVGLSSAEALGLYVKTLQEAGVNQQEMTFYMEALASDATALNPLLADNAAMLTAIGDSAESTGRILDESMIRNAKSMQTQWAQILDVMWKGWTEFWVSVGVGFGELMNIGAEAQLGEATDDVTAAINRMAVAQQRLNAVQEQSALGDDPTTAGGYQIRLREAEAEYKAAADAISSAKDEYERLMDLARPSPVPTTPPRVTSTTGSGTTTAGGGGGGGKNPAEEARKAFEQLMGSIDGTTKASNDFAKAQETVNAALANGVITQQEADLALSILTDRMKIAQGQMIDLSSVANVLENELTNAFMSILDGTESTKDAFKSMARAVIAELYKVLVVQRLVGSIGTATTAGSGLLGFIGNAFPALKGSASGGVLQAGQASVVGEHGRELFVPAVNGRVMSAANTQKMMSGGGGGVTVIQNNSFGAGVSRAEIQAMMPKIVESTKAAVFDAQRRSVNGMGYA